MSLSIGQVVDGYELLDYLDSSSKRIAFRARNVANQLIVQLQILPDSLRDDPERSARFFRESRILATLQHPNILTCHGVLELGGHLAISVEAMEAVTLADRLELGRMEIEEAVQSILQVLAAADAAHSAGVVHREISPSSVLTTPEKLVKLIGFSAAKTAGDPSFTRAGMLVGSAAYTAPEVFHGLAALDPRIDIYSIGCVFYALIAGRPPFAQKTEYEVMMAHIQTVPEPPSRFNPSINGVLDAVI
ncbi:MAG: serine/threonine-protein kinase, partial [Bryobacteraceae bacterium]